MNRLLCSSRIRHEYLRAGSERTHQKVPTNEYSTRKRRTVSGKHVATQGDETSRSASRLLLSGFIFRKNPLFLASYCWGLDFLTWGADFLTEVKLKRIPPNDTNSTKNWCEYFCRHQKNAGTSFVAWTRLRAKVMAKPNNDGTCLLTWIFWAISKQLYVCYLCSFAQDIFFHFRMELCIRAPYSIPEVVRIWPSIFSSLCTLVFRGSKNIYPASTYSPESHTNSGILVGSMPRNLPISHSIFSSFRMKVFEWKNLNEKFEWNFLNERFRMKVFE